MAREARRQPRRAAGLQREGELLDLAHPRRQGSRLGGSRDAQQEQGARRAELPRLLFTFTPSSSPFLVATAATPASAAPASAMAARRDVGLLYIMWRSSSRIDYLRQVFDSARAAKALNPLLPIALALAAGGRAGRAAAEQRNFGGAAEHILGVDESEQCGVA